MSTPRSGLRPARPTRGLSKVAKPPLLKSRTAAPGRPKQGPTLAEGRLSYSASGVSHCASSKLPAS